MIDIVLATYNGEKFLRQQLESIVNSDNYDELVNRVIVTDDNSRDSTRSIVSDFCDRKVVFTTNSSVPGVCGNFVNGLKHSTAKYVMFCDQDDFWLPSKIYKSHQAISVLEDNKGDEYPLVCFCDLEITDESLGLIERSFIKYHNIKFPNRLAFDKLALNNVTPGCSSIINRKMASYIINSNVYMDKWIMHDWWIMLIASKLGFIEFIPESLIKYRQHSGNVVGYKKNSLLIKLVRIFSTWSDYKKSLTERIIQYNAFCHFVDSLEIDSKSEGFIHLERDLMFIIKNECTVKRKSLGAVNFCLNGFKNK
ncbi:TPA: glycosyltransferase [Pluralibacter gergoviae]